MEQKGAQLDQETISCSICLDLLKDPVTTSCGHSYCMNCIKSHWDEEDQERIYSCPQCRKIFIPRPVLEKNTMLADLVEHLKKTGLQAAPADHCYAGPEDVSCDVCTGRKLKSIKSCLDCLVSYCKEHLQPHYNVAPLKKHQLVEPSKNLQENMCSLHDEVMKIFCRTDQQSICSLCLLDEHKGHETVSAAAERAEKQKELEGSRQQIQQRIQDREKDVELLQQEVEDINVSADKAVEDSEKMFTELIRLIQKRSSDVKQQVRSQQETEVSRVKELQEKLQQEINDLKRKDAQLEQLSNNQDHNQFLHNYPSLSALSESPHSSSIKIRPLSYFEDVTAAVSETRDELQDLLRDQWTNISLSVAAVDVLLSEPGPEPGPEPEPEPEPKTTEITLDPNTAHKHLLLSEGNRKVTTTGRSVPPPFFIKRGQKKKQTTGRSVPPPFFIKRGQKKKQTTGRSVPPPFFIKRGQKKKQVVADSTVASHSSTSSSRLPASTTTLNPADPEGPQRHTISLEKGPGGLGFSIIGGFGGLHGDFPIYVHSVFRKEAADGRLKHGDQILAVNGESLQAATHVQAVAIFRKQQGTVTLDVRSNPGRSGILDLTGQGR